MKIGGKDLNAAYVGSKALSAIRVGLVTIWEYIKSCFGRGYWDNTKPWNNSDAWKNNL